MNLLTNAVDMLPDGFPFSSEIKNITRALASESQGNLNILIFPLMCYMSFVRGIGLHSY